MKCVTVILVVHCGILCTAYSAPVRSQERAKIQGVLNLLKLLAKQQSSSHTKASEEVLAQAMKLAAAQFLPGPCPVGAFCSTSKQQSIRHTMAKKALIQAMKLAAAQIIGPCPPPLVCSTT